MSRPELVDASLFLGMHSADDGERRAAKGFFVSRWAEGVTMSLEHVGRCDDVIWGYSRWLQDLYYPFMDRLHTDMEIARLPYEEADLERALEDPLLAGLPLFDRLAVALAIRRDGTLYTLEPRLAERRDLPVARPPQPVREESFPDPDLEELYGVSLALRIGRKAPLEVAHA